MSTNLLKIISDMKAQLASLEAAIGSATPSKKSEKPEKPKKPLSPGMKMWHEFNARLDTLLKANDLKFNRVAEAKQFASTIKKEKEMSVWTDEEILVRCRVWVEEHKPVCVVCSQDANDDPSSHGACATSFIKTFMTEGKGTKDEGMAEWLKLSGLKAAKPDSDAEESVEHKKAGRPKMTDEQKAAAKAVKEAMTPEEKAEKVAKRLAAKKVKEQSPSVGGGGSAPPAKKAPGAPKKAVKVAWATAEEDYSARALLKELDEVIEGSE